MGTGRNTSLLAYLEGVHNATVPMYLVIPLGAFLQEAMRRARFFYSITKVHTFRIPRMNLHHEREHVPPQFRAKLGKRLNK